MPFTTFGLGRRGVIAVDDRGWAAPVGAGRPGTMRPGASPCSLVRKTSKTGTADADAELVQERYRHRHRFEFNLAAKPLFEEAGMLFPGLFIPDPEHPERHLVEMLERGDHPFFVATQAHPEFKSSPVKPHPLFKALVGTAYRVKQKE